MGGPTPIQFNSYFALYIPFLLIVELVAAPGNPSRLQMMMGLLLDAVVICRSLLFRVRYFSSASVLSCYISCLFQFLLAIYIAKMSCIFCRIIKGTHAFPRPAAASSPMM